MTENQNRFVSYNANPDGNRVGDCTVRAIATALNQSWEETYIGMCLYGLMEHDMPSADFVWGEYLKTKGFERELLRGRYTVKSFCEEYPFGTFLLAISGHVVAIIDGIYYDTFDSGNERPIYFWYRKEVF
ncbi:MAG: hypothetical protein IKY45_00190 [Clostridia bacterium]|nr:hypothetical protein [Clostridia bacterium]